MPRQPQGGAPQEGAILTQALVAAQKRWSSARGYETEETALRSLARHTPGCPAEVRRAALEQASRLLDAALERAGSVEVPRGGGSPYFYPSPADQRAIGQALHGVFPAFSLEACENAAAWAVFMTWK